MLVLGATNEVDADSMDSDFFGNHHIDQIYRKREKFPFAALDFPWCSTFWAFILNFMASLGLNQKHHGFYHSFQYDEQICQKKTLTHDTLFHEDSYPVLLFSSRVIPLQWFFFYLQVQQTNSLCSIY